MNNSCSMESFQIVRVNCEVNTEKSGRTALIANVKIFYEVPKDVAIRKLMLKTELTIRSEVPDMVNVLLVSQTVFNTEEFSGNIQELQEFIKNVYYAEIKKRMSASLKNITSAMGITPIDVNIE